MSDLLHRVRARQLRRFDFDRDEVLSRAVERLSRSRAPGAHSPLWTDARYGWGNEKWAAEEPYLAEVVRSAEASKGPILECGSGLTTVLMGAVAARRGIELHTLEHNPAWHARVVAALGHVDASTTVVHLAPLRDYGDCEWYDAPVDRMPNHFALVVCDGPPASTRGGRGGLLPTVREKLAHDCSILLDDANRAAERELIRNWSLALGGAAAINTTSRGFARLTIGGR
ncbi:MAG: hypothetical protein JWO39_1274 [Gemmatimonadetes bacterium]|nr:hypothetical protein [Gemmatimonadota bacterium]